MKNLKQKFWFPAFSLGFGLGLICLSCQMAFCRTVWTNEVLNSADEPMEFTVQCDKQTRKTVVVPPHALYVTRGFNKSFIVYDYAERGEKAEKAQFKPEAKDIFPEAERNGWAIERWQEICSARGSFRVPEKWLERSYARFLVTPAGQEFKGWGDKLDLRDEQRDETFKFLKDPDGDPDGDGLCNRDEMLSMCNPLVADKIAAVPALLPLNPKGDRDETITNVINVVRLAGNEKGIYVTLELAYKDGLSCLCAECETNHVDKAVWVGFEEGEGRRKSQLTVLYRSPQRPAPLACESPRKGQVFSQNESIDFKIAKDDADKEGLIERKIIIYRLNEQTGKFERERDIGMNGRTECHLYADSLRGPWGVYCWFPVELHVSGLVMGEIRWFIIGG